MERPGSRNLKVGAAWLAGGAGLTAITAAIFAGSGGMILFYGAMIVGGIQMTVGLFQMGVYAVQSPQAKARHHAEASAVTLLRCMALIANADGRADDREIEMIGIICDRTLGWCPPEPEVRRIVSEIGHGGTDPYAFVESKGRETPMAERLLIGRACYLVMMADGEAAKVETETFQTILNALGLSFSDVMASMNSLDRAAAS